MKVSKILSRCLVSVMILSSLSLAAHASTPLADTRLECGIPLDVYEATANPVPDGITYEYTMDEGGNYVLVGEEKDESVECDIPLDVYEATANPVPEGIVYEYVMDENGNFVLVETNPDLTEAFDPEGEPMPEGAFASPSTTTPETSGENFFTQLFSIFFNLFPI